MDVDEMLAEADEAQRQLEAEAIEMNAEMNPGDAQVTLLANSRIPWYIPDSPLPFPCTDGRTAWKEDPWWRTD
jgi:hypothetical protein